MVVRRTKEQIKAGFPHELATKGVDFKEWLKKNKQVNENKIESKNKKVTRRTKEQIDAGFPHELAVKGVDFKEWLEEKNKKAEEETETKEPGDSYRKKKISIPPPPTPKENIKEKEHKVEYVKHTETIIVESKDKNKVELRDLIKTSLDNCRWEWKDVPISKFKLKDLDKYGKEGWKLSLVIDKTLRPEIKDPVLCFQRPVEK